MFIYSAALSAGSINICHYCIGVEWRKKIDADDLVFFSLNDKKARPTGVKNTTILTKLHPGKTSPNTFFVVVY